MDLDRLLLLLIGMTFTLALLEALEMAQRAGGPVVAGPELLDAVFRLQDHSFPAPAKVVVNDAFVDLVHVQGR